jgi:hypothetical protein
LLATPSSTSPDLIHAFDATTDATAWRDLCAFIAAGDDAVGLDDACP